MGHLFVLSYLYSAYGLWATSRSPLLLLVNYSRRRPPASSTSLATLPRVPSSTSIPSVQLNSANRSTYRFMSRICFIASELVDGGGGQSLMSPSSFRTSSTSWPMSRRSVQARLPVLRLFFYLLSVSFRVCPDTAVHRIQVPRKVSHIYARVVRVWSSSLLLSIAHVSRTSVCLHHRQYDRLPSISGFFDTQISSVFRQCRLATSRLPNAHMIYIC